MSRQTSDANFHVRTTTEALQKLDEALAILNYSDRSDWFRAMYRETVEKAENKKGDKKMGKYFVSLYGRRSTSYCIYDEDLNFLKATVDKKETENLTELFKKSDITLSFYDDNELVGTTKGEIPDQLYKKGTRIEGAATAAAKAFKPKNWK
jgi:hypothetical protein